MSFRTDRARVRGLGTAGEGVHHWWSQRLSSVALVPLGILFLIPFGRALGGGYEAMQAVYSVWWNAFVAAAFILVGSLHLAQGLQVVIEDYVHDKKARTALLIATNLFGWGLAATGVFAVATILFGS